MPTALVRPSFLPTPASFTLSLTTHTTTILRQLELISSIGTQTMLQEALIGFLVVLPQTDTHNFSWSTHATPQRRTTSSVLQRSAPTMQTPLLVSTSITTTVLQYFQQVVVPLNSGSRLPSGVRILSFFFVFLLLSLQSFTWHRQLTGYTLLINHQSFLYNL